MQGELTRRLFAHVENDRDHLRRGLQRREGPAVHAEHPRGSDVAGVPRQQAQSRIVRVETIEHAAPCQKGGSEGTGSIQAQRVLSRPGIAAKRFKAARVTQFLVDLPPLGRESPSTALRHRDWRASKVADTRKAAGRRVPNAALICSYGISNRPLEGASRRHKTVSLDAHSRRTSENL